LAAACGTGYASIVGCEVVPLSALTALMRAERDETSIGGDQSDQKSSNNKFNHHIYFLVIINLYL
jgi:hypothetical protein